MHFLSDYCLLCHLLVGPPPAYVANGGPTVHIFLCLIVGSSVISLYPASFCLLYHLLVGPPSAYLASGGPTRNMCLRKSVSIKTGPPPLSHHTLYCYLQSRHST